MMKIWKLKRYPDAMYKQSDFLIGFRWLGTTPKRLLYIHLGFWCFCIEYKTKRGR